MVSIYWHLVTTLKGASSVCVTRVMCGRQLESVKVSVTAFVTLKGNTRQYVLFLQGPLVELQGNHIRPNQGSEIIGY